MLRPAGMYTTEHWSSNISYNFSLNFLTPSSFIHNGVPHKQRLFFCKKSFKSALNVIHISFGAEYLVSFVNDIFMKQASVNLYSMYISFDIPHEDPNVLKNFSRK